MPPTFDPKDPAFNDQIGIHWLPPTDEPISPGPTGSPTTPTATIDRSTTQAAACYNISATYFNTNSSNTTLIRPIPHYATLRVCTAAVDHTQLESRYPIPIQSREAPPATIYSYSDTCHRAATPLKLIPRTPHPVPHWLTTHQPIGVHWIHSLGYPNPYIVTQIVDIPTPIHPTISLGSINR